MPLQLHMEPRDGWVLATFQGSGSMQEVTGAFSEVADFCRRTNLPRLLVDFTGAMVPLSTLDRFDLGRGAEVFAGPRIRVASLARPEQLDPERFAETVAVNRGVRVRTFTELAAAVDWLIGG